MKMISEHSVPVGLVGRQVASADLAGHAPSADPGPVLHSQRALGKKINCHISHTIRTMDKNALVKKISDKDMVAQFSPLLPPGPNL